MLHELRRLHQARQLNRQKDDGAAKTLFSVGVIASFVGFMTQVLTEAQGPVEVEYLNIRFMELRISKNSIIFRVRFLLLSSTLRTNYQRRASNWPSSFNITALGLGLQSLITRAFSIVLSSCRTALRGEGLCQTCMFVYLTNHNSSLPITCIVATLRIGTVTRWNALSTAQGEIYGNYVFSRASPKQTYIVALARISETISSHVELRRIHCFSRDQNVHYADGSVESLQSTNLNHQAQG